MEGLMTGFARIAAAIAVFFFCFGSLPASAQTTGQTLDNASLKTALDGLGYETKALSKGYLVTSKVDTWTLYIQVVISSDGTKIGLNANLQSIDDFGAVPAKKWLDLLVSNGQIDPSTFYVDRDQKKLYLHRVIDNRSITPVVLRSQLDNFTNNIISTEATWDLTK
jgi:hypothetical protein